MTDAQKIKIGNLREAGYGYKKIADEMGLSENTVKTYCRRHGLGGYLAKEMNTERQEKHLCLCCGVPVEQLPGRKEKKFCSDKCRNKWWNAHLDKVNRKAVYEYECPHCKKSFTAYGNANRKYCSHECYIADRFGGGSDE